MLHSKILYTDSQLFSAREKMYQLAHVHAIFKNPWLPCSKQLQYWVSGKRGPSAIKCTLVQLYDTYVPRNRTTIVTCCTCTSTAKYVLNTKKKQQLEGNQRLCTVRILSNFSGKLGEQDSDLVLTCNTPPHRAQHFPATSGVPGRFPAPRPGGHTDAAH